MRIMCIFGEVCSGKNTYAEQYLKYYDKVDIGDIVRQLTKTTERVHIESLDTAIINELHRFIVSASESKKSGIVVTGIRQRSILIYIEQLAETMDFQVDRLILEVPRSVLKKRYEKRGAKKDQVPFEEAIARDNKLGYTDLLEYLKIVNTHTIKNYYHNELDEIDNTLQTG